MADEAERSHSLTARVLFRLLRDNLPAGVVDSAIEHARIQKDVPDTALGHLACELADKIDALSE